MELVYIILIMFFGMIGAWLFARWLDPYWRVKTYRKWLKKDYWLVYLVSRDNSRITPYVVNIDQSAIRFKNNLFIIENGSIYNEAKPEMALNIHKLVDEKYIKWREETVPTIYVSEDSIVPLEFDKWERKINPKEIDAGLTSMVINMNSRNNEQKKENLLTWILVLCFACILITGYVAYVQYNFMNDITEGNIIVQKTTTDGKIIGDTTTSLPSQKDNDKIVITT